MTAALALMVAAAPLALVPGVLARSPVALTLAPWAAAPALALALWPPPASPEPLSWLLLGARLGFDTIGRPFLFLTSVLWFLAGLYGRDYLAGDEARHRFFVFYLAAMSGNLGLILALDIASFYLFFALMSFATYGLVVHDGSPAARRAGRIYIGMAVLGEACLFTAAVAAASVAGSLEFAVIAGALATASGGGAIIGLAWVGLGIKAGALGMHVWLPLAHALAPTPASAVLSGAMIKAGLLGWLRILPLGDALLPGWGTLAVAAGFGAVFYGAGIGVIQDDPKTVLAYSSVSQMGFVTIGVGLGLLAPASWPVVLGAVQIYALHHALNKAALFLGTGVAAAAASRVQRWLVTMGLAIPALALAGAPLTTGAVAKAVLKSAVDMSAGGWAGALALGLSLAAVSTTLLMARVLWLTGTVARPGRRTPSGRLWGPWAVLLGVTLASVPLLAVSAAPPGITGKTLTPAGLWAGFWPVAVGALLAAGAWWWTSRTRATLPRVPAGDILALAVWLTVHSGRAWPAGSLPAAHRMAGSVVGWYRWTAARDPRGTEGWLTTPTAIGALALLLAAALLVSLAAF